MEKRHKNRMYTSAIAILRINGDSRHSSRKEDIYVIMIKHSVEFLCVALRQNAFILIDEQIQKYYN